MNYIICMYIHYILHMWINMTVDNEYNSFFVVIAWSGEVIMRDWLTWMFINLLIYQHANYISFEYLLKRTQKVDSCFSTSYLYKMIRCKFVYHFLTGSFRVCMFTFDQGFIHSHCDYWSEQTLIPVKSFLCLVSIYY